MSASVDVLAVMRHAGTALHGFADEQSDPTQTRTRADSLIAARAAVAELIGAEREFDHAAAHRIEADNRIIVRGDRSDDAFRRKCSADHAYDRAADRRRAALAALSGGAA